MISSYFTLFLFYGFYLVSGIEPKYHAGKTCPDVFVNVYKCFRRGLFYNVGADHVIEKLTPLLARYISQEESISKQRRNVLLDIGANEGQELMLFLKLCRSASRKAQCEVLSVESNPFHIPMLQGIANVASPHTHVTIINAAAGGLNQRDKIFTFVGRGQQGKLISNVSTAALERYEAQLIPVTNVTVLTISEIITDWRRRHGVEVEIDIPIIKVDAEGYDNHILSTFASELSDVQSQLLLWEMNKAYLTALPKASPELLAKSLMNNGYRVFIVGMLKPEPVGNATSPPGTAYRNVTTDEFILMEVVRSYATRHLGIFMWLECGLAIPKGGVVEQSLVRLNETEMAIVAQRIKPTLTQRIIPSCGATKSMRCISMFRFQSI
jgi:FkbM family methyltransferase